MIVDACKYLYSLLMALNENSFHYFYYNSYKLFFVLFLFCYTSFSISNMSENSNKAYTILYNLSLKTFDNPNDAAHQINIFMNFLKEPTVTVNAFKLFIINRSFVLTVLSATLTYSVIIAQMS